MVKYWLGILTVLVVVALSYGGIVLFDLLGVVSKNELIFQAMTGLTGLKHFQENYELGQKRSRVLQKKESELAAAEARLTAREAKIAADYAEFENQKQLWLKAHPVAAKAGKDSPVPQKPSPTDPALKNYLATLGAMKPEKAAAVIQKLPDETVFLIFDQLSNRQASKLMENLPPEYLTRLTQARLQPKTM